MRPGGGFGAPSSFGLPWPRSTVVASAGASVSAVMAEQNTEAASASENSRNRRPMLPSSSEMGANTAISTAVVAITAMPTSREPRKAASSGGSPSSMRRWMFSTTTMVSSTTRPTASTRASRVRMFTEKPST